MIRRAAPLLLLLLPALAPAQEPGRDEPPPAGRLESPPSIGQPGEVSPPAPGDVPVDRWGTEEEVPEPPLLRLHGGQIAWVDARTSIRSDRRGVIGTTLDDLEADQGLDSGGAAPWIEATIGRTFRAGFDATFFAREGDLVRQDDRVVLDGRVVAERGGYVRSRFSLLNLGALLEWDFLYDSSYRIGLTGGARYFAFDLRLKSVPTPTSTAFQRTRTRGELISPFFGGLVELTPFPYLSVLARIEFMNWSWRSVGLREARYFSLRLGAAVHPIPGRVSVGLEFRFSRVRAEGRDDDGGDRVDGSIGTAGVALVGNFSF